MTLKPDFLRHSLDQSLNHETLILHTWFSLHFNTGNKLFFKNLVAGGDSVHRWNGEFRGFSLWSGVRFSNICYIIWFVVQLGPIHQALLSLGNEFMFLINILCPALHQQGLACQSDNPHVYHICYCFFFSSHTRIGLLPELQKSIKTH